MKVQIVALMAVLVYSNTAGAQTLVACSCDIANTVCLTDVEMFEHAIHIEMEPDRMGNHSNYRGLAVFQIGLDEKGCVTGADAISGQPLGISHLVTAVSKWRFKPVVMKGIKKKGCGILLVKFSMKENVPLAWALKGPFRDEKPPQPSSDENSWRQ